jgi:polyphosphate kinase
MKDEQSLLINRDLSWLEFNRRVLEEAKDPSVPLLGRVKFLAIFSSNLDEFFTVRVAGLKRGANNRGTSSAGITEASVLTAISKKVHELAEEQHLCFLDTILPQLTAEGIHLLRPEEISREQEQFLEDYFRKTLYPIVTPLAIDPGHPFPYLANRSLCFSCIFAGKRHLAFASHGTFYRSYPSSSGPEIHSASEQGRAIRIRVAGRCPPAIFAASLPWF